MRVGPSTLNAISAKGLGSYNGTKAWYSVHAVSTAAWGLSPIEDQQLGGLIMWVPAGLLLTGYALAAFGWELSRLIRVNAERA
jgi:putative membrane protein